MSGVDIDLAMLILERMGEGPQNPYLEARQVLALLGSSNADVRLQGAELLASSGPDAIRLVGWWASQALYLHEGFVEEPAYQWGRRRFLTDCITHASERMPCAPERVSDRDQALWLLGYWGPILTSEGDISPELLRPEIRRTPGSKGKAGSNQEGEP